MKQYADIQTNEGGKFEYELTATDRKNIKAAMDDCQLKNYESISLPLRGRWQYLDDDGEAHSLAIESLSIIVTDTQVYLEGTAKHDPSLVVFSDPIKWEISRFPNGFDDWQETHAAICLRVGADLGQALHPSYLKKWLNKGGTGNVWEQCKDLTFQFEEKYKGVTWGDDLDWFDELDLFLNEKLV